MRGPGEGRWHEGGGFGQEEDQRLPGGRQTGIWGFLPLLSSFRIQLKRPLRHWSGEGQGIHPRCQKEKGKKTFRELPAPRMGPGGAALPCRASRAALKFLEKALVQRRIGNRLPGSSFCPGRRPGQEGAGQEKASRLRPAQSGPGRAHTATPEGRTEEYAAAWGPGVGSRTPHSGWQIAGGRQGGQQGAGRQSVLSGKKPSVAGFRGRGFRGTAIKRTENAKYS